MLVKLQYIFLFNHLRLKIIFHKDRKRIQFSDNYEGGDLYDIEISDAEDDDGMNEEWWW